jgi:RNA polymerase sigma-70 factor (ECF subfamily)
MKENSEIVESIYREYAPLVRRACRMVADSCQLAEDAEQEVWFAVWDVAVKGGLARVRDWPAYLFTLASRACARVGKQSRRSVAPGKRVDGMPVEVALPATRRGDEINPADARRARAEKAARLRAMQGAIDALPTRQRIAFKRHYLEGMSHGEIGQSMGSSRKASQELVRRARLNLRAALAAPSLEVSVV